MATLLACLFSHLSSRLWWVLLGCVFGNDSPEAYGLGTVEELFDEEISEEDTAAEENQMTKKEIFVEYILKNKVIWLLCFANIFFIHCSNRYRSMVYRFTRIKN